MTSDLKEKQGLPPWLINLEEMLEDNLSHNDMREWYSDREIIESRLAKKQELQLEDYKNAIAEQRIGRCLEVLLPVIDNKWYATEHMRLIQALHNKKVPRDHHLWLPKIQQCQEVCTNIKTQPFNFYSQSALAGVKAAMYSQGFTAESALCAAKCQALVYWSEATIKAQEKIAWKEELKTLHNTLKGLS